MMRAIWGVALACVLAACPVSAGAGDPGKTSGTTVAYFQSKNIFHSGLNHSHTIALTFDDGPNAHTDEVLDELSKLHVKATFFIVGHMAHLHPATLKRIAAEGHLLANHSAT